MRQAMREDEPSNPYDRQERAAVPGKFGLHSPVLAAAVCAEASRITSGRPPRSSNFQTDPPPPQRVVGQFGQPPKGPV